MAVADPTGTPTPHKSRRRALRVLLPLGVLAAGYAATTIVPTVANAASAPMVKEVKSAKFGEILVNAQGRTLYRYTPDTSTKVACTGGCAVSWPPLNLPSGTTKPVGGPGVTGLTTIKVGGKMQVEYKGHPLYTFIGDKKAGATTGQGLEGTWFVVNVGKQASSASAAPKTSPTTAKPASSSVGY
jgi:predicted lipoprotein with Yx(FWY)xxD motif